MSHPPSLSILGLIRDHNPSWPEGQDIRKRYGEGVKECGWQEREPEIVVHDLGDKASVRIERKVADLR